MSQPADAVTGWLIDECRSASSRISSIMLLSERITAAGIAILAFAANVAVAQGEAQLLMTLPGLFAALVCYVAYINAEVYALGGYIAAAEEVISKRLGHPLLIWESSVAPRRHRSVPTMIFRVILLLLWSVTAFGAVVEARATAEPNGWGHDMSRLWICMTVGSIAIGLAAMAAAFWGQVRERGRTYALASELYGLAAGTTP